MELAQSRIVNDTRGWRLMTPPGSVIVMTTITTTARRITRLVNQHARAPHARTATMGGIRLCLDTSGHELVWHTLGEAFAGADCPEGTAYQWTVHPGGTTSYANVQTELDYYSPQYGAGWLSA